MAEQKDNLITGENDDLKITFEDANAAMGEVDEDVFERRNTQPGQEWFWIETWQKAEREVEIDLAAGNYETFDTLEDFLKDLK